LASASADSAYGKEPVYEAIEGHSPERRTRVIIPPQRKAILSAHSKTAHFPEVAPSGIGTEALKLSLTKPPPLGISRNTSSLSLLDPAVAVTESDALKSFSARTVPLTVKVPLPRWPSYARETVKPSRSAGAPAATPEME
jgi:hypothetical protein